VTRHNNYVSLKKRLAGDYIKLSTSSRSCETVGDDDIK